MEGDPGPLDPPIHVDWIDPAVLADGLPGRLGLTILPGKRGKSIRYPGLVYRRDARADLVRLHGMGVGLLALLVEDRELERWGDPALVEQSPGLVRRFPIPMATRRSPWTVLTRCSR